MRSPGGSPHHEAGKEAPGAGSAAPAALDAAAAAIARASGQPERADRLRADTPLAGLGIDSLGMLCVGDLLAEGGWHLPDAAAMEAATVGDVARALVPEDVT